MKTMLLITGLSALLITGYSQGTSSENKSGKVIFDEMVKLDIKLDGESAQYADLLPKERTSKKVLYFTPEMSLFLEDTDKQKEILEQESEGGMVQLKVMTPDEKVFRDLKENKMYEQREFMSRKFLIETVGGKSDWKLTGEQKSILNYNCQEAVRENDGRKIRAWFTPMIPVSTGPQNYGDLPGLILAVDIDNGQRTLTATQIEFTNVGKDKLVRPKEGKKVTAEQYRKIVDEKMKEMGAEGGNGQNVMIRIQR